ncbi:hypothetical protein Leryth_022574 [Lithospermum erythrorhizon]|nr:hypothetical protein Leryth_022574 [Lithospermum erythrorhizon]
MDYLKTVVPSHLLAERGSNLVIINPGSGNIRIGLAQHDVPFNIPHCIARRTTQTPKKILQDQLLNSHVTTAQHVERERAYDIIASLLKIPFLDEDGGNRSFSQKMGRVDGYPPHESQKEPAFSWTDVIERVNSNNKDEPGESLLQRECADSKEPISSGNKYKEYICGEEALTISPTEPYCLRRPIRRGHLNISLHYPMQQVIEDLQAIWDWVLVEKLQIPHSQRNMYSAVLVVPETFDNREIKEVLSIVLRDLRFSSAVVHLESLAAVFGSGLSTACVVNVGAQVTSVVCVEDGVSLPTTQITLRYGGEDISRCLLWTQRHHQTWPNRDLISDKAVDSLMLK